MHDELDPIYQEYILDLYRHPHNKGVLDHADAQAEEFNPSCGDKIALMIKFDGGMVRDVAHDGQGCAISQAGVSLLTDYIKGKTKSELQQMTEEQAKELLGIPISHTRRKCAILGWLTLQKCV